METVAGAGRQEDVPSWQPIKEPEKYFEVKMFPEDVAPKKAIGDLEKVKDQRCASFLEEGKPLTAGRPGEQGSDRPGRCSCSPDSGPPPSRSTPSRSSAASSCPARHVDVICTTRDGEKATKLILQNMLVLAADTVDTKDPATKTILGPDGDPGRHPRGEQPGWPWLRAWASCGCGCGTPATRSASPTLTVTGRRPRQAAARPEQEDGRPTPRTTRNPAATRWPSSPSRRLPEDKKDRRSRRAEGRQEQEGRRGRRAAAPRRPVEPAEGGQVAHHVHPRGQQGAKEQVKTRREDETTQTEDEDEGNDGPAPVKKEEKTEPKSEQPKNNPAPPARTGSSTKTSRTRTGR